MTRRHQTRRGASLPGLLLILAALGGVFYLAFGRTTQPVEFTDDEGETQQVDQTNAAAFARQKSCEALCTRRMRACRASALDEAARAACAGDRDDCQADCREER